jgi:hypothetical protein
MTTSGIVQLLQSRHFQGNLLESSISETRRDYRLKRY